MRIYLLEREREIERSRRLAFAFSDGAFNLERITLERITLPFLLFWVPNARLSATASGIAAPASR
jgi:hypothetical protein